MEYLLPYLCMVTVPHIMVRLERMLDCRGVGLARFHCMHVFVVILEVKFGIWWFGYHPRTNSVHPANNSIFTAC